MTDSAVGALELDQRPLVQLLTPEGERVEHPDYAYDPDSETLRSLYRDLVLVRRIDVEATALQRQGELGIWASLLGQEAAQIGSGRALAPQDYVFPTYREHGVAWCREVDPVTLLGLYRGVNLGGWDPNAHNFHLYTIVIGSHTLHATGYAMGIQRDGAEDAAIVYFGDGATSEGDVNEAFIWASVNKPVDSMMTSQPSSSQGNAAGPSRTAKQRIRWPLTTRTSSSARSGRDFSLVTSPWKRPWVESYLRR